jgi:hypothetical protein
MDILGTKNTWFEKEFDYLENVCAKETEQKNYIQKEHMTVAKFSVMECEMMPHVG